MGWKGMASTDLGQKPFAIVVKDDHPFNRVERTLKDGKRGREGERERDRKMSVLSVSIQSTTLSTFSKSSLSPHPTNHTDRLRGPAHVQQLRTQRSPSQPRGCAASDASLHPICPEDTHTHTSVIDHLFIPTSPQSPTHVLSQATA
jgi:hypothetical protein